jgi:hypothetical protein
MIISKNSKTPSLACLTRKLLVKITISGNKGKEQETPKLLLTSTKQTLQYQQLITFHDNKNKANLFHA